MMNDVALRESIPRELVKEIAMDIGKEVAAYIERQYPDAVTATSSTFLLSVRNSIYNEIIAALETTNEDDIRRLLADRKRARRQLRAAWKRIRAMTPGDGSPEAVARAMDTIHGRFPLADDL